jgi:hypothetical protein
MAIAIKHLPAGFVFPAQPVLRSKPPVGTDWVHEIKHDGYRMIIRRDCAAPQPQRYDWTARLSAIATPAQRIKGKSFTIDGEAAVLGPDGLSRFEELSRREAARTAILYTFDLIEHDGLDLRNLPFLDRKIAPAGLLRNTNAGILLNEHIAQAGATVFLSLRLRNAGDLGGGQHPRGVILPIGVSRQRFDYLATAQPSRSVSCRPTAGCVAIRRQNHHSGCGRN